MVTIRKALSIGMASLKLSDTPFLDASLLLGHILGLSKEKLFASYPEHVSEKALIEYEKVLEQRERNIPIAYILKKQEFYGLSFFVDNRVLIPRPDTETLIETAIGLLKKHTGLRRILDLCTGSGCIGITMKHCIPDLTVTCSDISSDALEVCSYNSTVILGETLPLIKSNLFDNISGVYDMILSNPPYLTRMETEEMYTNHWPEPSLALAGGVDGLTLIHRIITKADTYLAPGGYILLESAPDQTYSIERELFASGFKESFVIKDLAERNRITVGRKPE